MTMPLDANTDKVPAQAVVDAFLDRFASDLSGYSVETVISHMAGAESFEIHAAKSGAKIHATIKASNNSALRYALNAMLRWITDGCNGELTLNDSPDFKVRGVIEGFYGKPWSHEQRKRGIANFADFNMNTFMIAPKDSPWQRFNWRAPFTDEFLAKAKELVDHGNLHGVNVSVAVSPGLSVVYSSQADRDAVLVRYKQLSEIGVRHFGLLWDDISWELNDPTDAATYKTTALAHADFTNAIYEGLKKIDPHAILTMCPMHYSGRGNEPYLLDIGNNLNKEINLFWTGRSILSEYLEIFDAEIFEKTTKRYPLYWDNFPVNDGSLRYSLFITPVMSREKGLDKYSAGLLSNPMTQFEMSQLPLGTIGDYLWDTQTYEPFESWERSLVKMLPNEADRTALRAMLRCTMNSCVGGDPAPDLRPVFGSGTSARRAGDLKKAESIFKAAGEEILKHADHLEKPGFSRPEIIEEVRPWLHKFRLGGKTLIAFGDVIGRCSFDADQRMLVGDASLIAELAKIQEELEAPKQKMFGDQIDGSISELMSELGYNSERP
jgi:hyaluronoglucosaminidase